MIYNHKIKSTPINYEVKPGSRNRLRIPTAGLRHCGIKPGDRVHVGFDWDTLDIYVEKWDLGKYKVEKNGAVRIPAHKFGLASHCPNNMSADSISRKVFIS